MIKQTVSGAFLVNASLENSAFRSIDRQITGVGFSQRQVRLRFHPGYISLRN